jgi:tetratricopeptide (TPR) repeat protein
MSTPQDQEVELLRRLLRRAEGEQPTDHLDEETLVLFSQAALSDNERQQAIEHLADCTQCREIVAELLQFEEDDLQAATPAEVSRPRLAAWSGATRYVVFALAACLLLAVTLVLVQPDLWSASGAVAERKTYEETSKLLALRQFDAARNSVAEAARNGTRSDRLQSLDAQAARRMATPVALAEAGRLTDFGVDVTGAVGRAPEDAQLTEGLVDAKNVLARIGTRSVEALLNRGHVALSSHQIDAALGDFNTAVQLAPNDPMTYLGRGIAHYMNDDLSAAEQDFRHALRLAPDLAAARMNLAITLTEESQPELALRQWQDLLSIPLKEEERQQVNRAIELLKNR